MRQVSVDREDEAAAALSIGKVVMVVQVREIGRRNEDLVKGSIGFHDWDFLSPRSVHAMM